MKRNLSSSSNTSGQMAGESFPTLSFVEEPVNLELTDNIKKHIGREVFLFSCRIVKYNQYGWRNTRHFLLTQESIMLLKNKCKDLRRKVSI
jgi:hypothetical protein